MSVSSALSSFLQCCFYPSGGHRGGAYYYSSHPTSANTLYGGGYQEGPLGGRRMMGRRSRPLSLQVRASFFLALFFPSVRACTACETNGSRPGVRDCDVTCSDLFSARHATNILRSTTVHVCAVTVGGAQ